MKHFKIEEFDQKDGNCPAKMDADFLVKIDELRERCGFPLVITSGYRSPEYNKKVSSTGTTGPHTTGKAADIAVRGQKAHTLLKHALELGFTGIGISQKGQSRFIHLDTIEGTMRPWVWSY